jgi:hypothetical protein
MGVAIAVVALVLGGACGGDGNRDKAIESLMESGLTETESVCYADRVVDEFGSGKVVELTAVDPEPTVTPEDQTTLDAIRSECLNLASYVDPRTDTTDGG